jgi:DsbC/DsbD-like thiol-disulfide interchange protein
MLRCGGALGLLGMLVVPVGCSSSTLRPLQQASAKAAPSPSAASQPVEQQAAPPPPAPEHDETVVKFAFNTTATAIVPGSTFWLAAHFRLAPGYRIFWENPGDVGRPTKVKFTAPAGFEVSDARLPAPKEFELPQDGTSYGYEKETAAFAQVRALPDLDTRRSYRFEVEAHWLACNERCYPENTTAFIEFGVDATAKEVPFEPNLAALHESLPQPLSDLAGATYRWKRGGRLHVSAGKTKWLGFLPARPSDPKLVEIRVGAKKGELKLRFEDGTPTSRVKGLAIASVPEGVSYVMLDIPWPVKAEKSSSP